MEVELIDDSCPRDIVYRMNAEYVRTRPEWSDKVPDEATTVLMRHPDVDLSQWPWLDDGRFHERT